MTDAPRPLQGWGGFPVRDAVLIEPRSLDDWRQEVGRNPLIARGLGRSYGDSANAATVLQTTFLDHYAELDAKTGRVTCEAGVVLRDLLDVIVPQGWFLPVAPGTALVTVGGAIASDVHGKNHHNAGTFCQHIESMTLLLGNGEIVTTSATEKPELFHATCGGMGLTGVILMATVRLLRIRSASIEQRTLKARCLEEVCEQFDAHQQATYSVAWIDCVARGRNLGRSVLILGEHAEAGGFKLQSRQSMSVPIYAPSGLLNKWTVTGFNALYFARARNDHRANMSLRSFFFPLDAIGTWNRLYGRRGFVQYQFVVPAAVGVAGLRSILKGIADSGKGSFLAVLKAFGPANDNLLSFPSTGYTLALDFKVEPDVFSLLDRLDQQVLNFGGRLYLTKDARMSEATFKKSYPRWQEFEAIRRKWHAIGNFSSDQSIRLGLR